ncbi:MAG: UDP-N-acetylmuramate dehydrogenase [Lachnospiraceae bacterium]|nr:UDP-N-acetylmuramate dehydrogenase [Lachnospiraceae bacterium]
MTDDLIKSLLEICGEENVFENEPLSRHTSFRIGGPARVFVTPPDEECLGDVIKACDASGVRRFILGNGTNVLASDEGYNGVIIQVYKNFSEIKINGTKIKAGAGVLLSKLSSEAAGASLSGFEFASGIPGTLGGAVTMNAGAYGGEMKDVLTDVTVYVPGEGIKVLDPAELKLGYRTSIIKNTDIIVLSAGLQLERGDEKAIRERIAELKEQRTSKQPLEYPSAGSTFKRPEGYFAGKLIMDSGLKGYCVGGACVSEKHCGFVINKGNATAADVKELMEHIVKTVEDKFGVRLEPEILCI